MDFSFIFKLIDADKVAGHVRAWTAAGLAYLVVQMPALSDVLTQNEQNAIGVVAAGLAVGIWSHLAKMFAKPTA